MLFQKLTNERKDYQIDDWMDRWTYEYQLDDWMDRWTYEQQKIIDEQKDKLMKKLYMLWF